MELRLDFSCIFFIPRRDALSVSWSKIFNFSFEVFIGEARIQKKEHSDDTKSKTLMECFNIFTADDTSKTNPKNLEEITIFTSEVIHVDGWGFVFCCIFRCNLSLPPRILFSFVSLQERKIFIVTKCGSNQPPFFLQKFTAAEIRTELKYQPVFSESLEHFFYHNK